MKLLTVILGLIILIAIEVLRVYFIMPFPGSQHSNSIAFAYWIGSNIIWLRLLIAGLIIYPLFDLFRKSSTLKKVILAVMVLLYGFVFYMFNFRFLAETMFYQPKTVSFFSKSANKVSEEKLVLGVEINGEAKAYPLQQIGYHHQVRDTVGGKPVMVTYCTVCRTGRVFSPFVNGKNETFRLVGMDHFNAMFEDQSTKSWWRQVSGEAAAGPLKGQKLEEIPSRQMRLSAWLQLYPSSVILQPDPSFTEDYDELAKYDNGNVKSSLEKRDSLSWRNKSWVVGIKSGKFSKAYDWNDFVTQKLIQDSLAGLAFVIVLQSDSASFHAYNRRLNGINFNFRKEQKGKEILLVDENTGSFWNVYGSCISGQLKGAQLGLVNAYQEFWHSWKTFNPGTSR